MGALLGEHCGGGGGKGVRVEVGRGGLRVGVEGCLS